MRCDLLRIFVGRRPPNESCVQQPRELRLAGMWKKPEAVVGATFIASLILSFILAEWLSPPRDDSDDPGGDG